MTAPMPDPHAPEEAAAGPAGLEPTTAEMVDRFAEALKAKLRCAELKYGYRDGWADANWQADCVEALYEHVSKGDPLDVAAYAAFCWHHRWSTNSASGDAGEIREKLARLIDPNIWEARDRAFSGEPYTPWDDVMDRSLTQESLSTADKIIAAWNRQPPSASVTALVEALEQSTADLSAVRSECGLAAQRTIAEHVEHNLAVLAAHRAQQEKR